MVRDDKGLVLSAALLAMALLTPSDDLAGETGPRRFLIQRVGGPTMVDAAVEEAVRGAAAKLESPECREVFSDFRDSRGHTLSENLAELGESPRSYLGLMVFYEGSGYSRCESREIFATTTPGSRAVSVCGPQFADRHHREPGLASVLILHEELHSLGLGENPPSSTEITARVAARCGL